MICVLLSEGFEEVEVLMPVDMLMRAGLDVEIVSISDSLLVKSTRGICIQAHKLLNDIEFDSIEALVLPGGQPGADNLFNSNAVKKMILDCYDKSILLAAICASPYVFGELGLLKGRNATCYPGMESHLIGANYLKDNQVVEDNGIITGKAAGAAAEFAIAIGSHFVDREIMLKVKDSMFIQI